jgi:hypothetical protein
MNRWVVLIEWLLLIAGCAAVMVFHVLVTFQIVESELKHADPVGLCRALDWYVTGLIVAQIVAIQCTIPVFSMAWPIAVAGFAMLVHIWSTRKRRTLFRFFDPATIVRDSYRLKIRHGIGVVLHFLSVLYCIVMMSFAARSLE